MLPVLVRGGEKPAYTEYIVQLYRVMASLGRNIDSDTMYPTMFLTFLAIALLANVDSTTAFLLPVPAVARVNRKHFVLPSQSLPNDSTNAASSSSNGSIRLRNCPFSRTFPRYRVDLTRSGPQDGKRGFSWFGGVFQRSSLRNRLVAQFTSDELQWAEGQGGVEAFATLWKAAARLVSTTTTTNAGDETEAVVVALPDCDKRILVNWKELMDWIQDTMLDQGRIETMLLEDNQVVRMIRSSNVACRSVTSTSLDNVPATSSSLVSDTIIEARTKAWVKRLLVELAICPFTKSVTKSGQGLAELNVPVANIAYHTSKSTTVYQLLADTWEAIHDMIEAGPSGKDGISSILLAAPAFDHNFDLWSGPIFTLLESCVVAAQAESQIGVVCFHPLYATPDGTSWPGFGHMHSVPRLERWVQEVEGHSPYSSDEIAAGGAWQRRTPHATINVLRADQLELAESKRNTPKLYARNIQVLMDIGNERLLQDLEQERTIGS